MQISYGGKFSEDTPIYGKKGSFMVKSKLVPGFITILSSAISKNITVSGGEFGILPNGILRFSGK